MQKWVRSSLRHLSDRLKDAGHPVSPPMVARLLRKLGYSLRVNAKKREATSAHPDRQAQFEVIASQRQVFDAAGWPIVSVDTKKKELIGNFKNAGRAWGQEAEAVNVHDFPHDALLRAVPYGIYDVGHNRGSVYVGTSADTPEFAVAALARNRTLTRATRLQQEQAALRPLPRLPLAPCREFRVSVSRFSTISVLGKRYSVPSRLIGTTVLARLRAETVEVYVGTRQVLTLPRIQGATTHAVNYRHVIWSLVRKPGAFAHYRYREDLFPTLAFRQAYDALCQQQPQHADRHYVRVLHLAATTSESEVETAIGLLLEQSQVPTFDAVRDLGRVPQIPALGQMHVNLQAYDQLLSSQQRRSHA